MTEEIKNKYGLRPDKEMQFIRFLEEVVANNTCTEKRKYFFRGIRIRHDFSPAVATCLAEALLIKLSMNTIDLTDILSRQGSTTRKDWRRYVYDTLAKSYSGTPYVEARDKGLKY